ncbi:winged helix-turn-helix domain-containing protein [Azospirillum endophyticum]
MPADLRVRFLHPSGAIGPGKIALLEAIDRTGSISAAARSLDMTFRRAWFLVETMNTAFREPVIRTSVGGREGGGAGLTPLGQEVVARYRQTEEEARKAAEPHLRWLNGVLKEDAPETSAATDAVGMEPPAG